MTFSDEEINCELKRHLPENPYNYTNEELAERKKALKDLEKDYPHLPFGWLEMVYDWHKSTDPEEVTKIINEKTWEVPGKFSENKTE